MASDVVLDSSTRENLLSLNRAKALSDRTAKRINTGLKVASASDDPVAYFQSKTLSDRASDFLVLKDNVQQAAQCASAMVQGCSSVETLLLQLKGQVLSANDLSGDRQTSLAQQFDFLRQQINNLVTDTTYAGNSLVAGGPPMTVAVSPVASSSYTINSHDLRVSSHYQVDDIVTAWRDDSTAMGNSLATRSFFLDRQPQTDESLGPLDNTLNGGPTITRLVNGNSVVGWDSSGVGAGTITVRDASGHTLNSISVDNANELQVSALDDGRFAAVWSDGSNFDIKAAVYKEDGSNDGSPITVLPGGSFANFRPRISATSGGGFIVGCASEIPSGISSNTDIVYREYDSSGLPKDVGQSITNTGDCDYPDVAGLTGGGKVVAWQSSGDNGAYAMTIDAEGNQGTAFRLDSGGGISTEGVRVAPLADGGFVAAWSENDGLGGNYVHSRTYNADGSGRTGEHILTDVANGGLSGLASLTNGGFALTFSANDGGGFSDSYLATFGADGHQGGAPTRLNQTTAISQDHAVVASATLYDLAQPQDDSPGELVIRRAAGYNNFATANDRQLAVRAIDRAIATTRTISAEFGISQALLSGRLQFNDEYAKTLIAGADKLVLADLNEEGANTLALQVRYQLGMQALTFLSQSQQSILKVFR